MKTLFDHIEHVKGKPHHVRRRIAFTIATCGAGLIALVWLVGSVSLGSFAIAPTSFADSTGGTSLVTTNETNRPTGLAGAAAALPSNTSGPARIEIVDTASSTKATKQGGQGQTLLPF